MENTSFNLECCFGQKSLNIHYSLSNPPTIYEFYDICKHLAYALDYCDSSIKEVFGTD